MNHPQHSRRFRLAKPYAGTQRPSLPVAAKAAMAPTACRHAPKGARPRLSLLEPAAVLLLGNIAPNGLLVQPDGARAVAPGPKGLVLPDDPAPFRVPVAQHHGALALHVPRHVGHRQPRRHPHAGVHAATAHAAPRGPAPPPLEEPPTGAPTSGLFCRWRSFPCTWVSTLCDTRPPVRDEPAARRLPSLPAPIWPSQQDNHGTEAFSLSPKPCRVEPSTHHRHSLWASFRY